MKTKKTLFYQNSEHVIKGEAVNETFELATCYQLTKEFQMANKESAHLIHSIQVHLVHHALAYQCNLLWREKN